MLFRIPYSKNLSLNTMKNTIKPRIIAERNDCGLNKTLYKNKIDSPKAKFSGEVTSPARS